MACENAINSMYTNNFCKVFIVYFILILYIDMMSHHMHLLFTVIYTHKLKDLFNVPLQYLIN